jgi:proteasome lid subunit RPN8/RPN11
MVILICKQVYEEMLAHLRAVYPEEGCGFLAKEENESVLCRHFPIENTQHSPTTYQMNPQQQVNALLQIGENDFAIYHSHPHTPPHPSPTDIHQATYPRTPYLICSFANFSTPIARAFTIQNSQVVEHNITIV